MSRNFRWDLVLLRGNLETPEAFFSFSFHMKLSVNTFTRLSFYTSTAAALLRFKVWNVSRLPKSLQRWMLVLLDWLSLERWLIFLLKDGLFIKDKWELAELPTEISIPLILDKTQHSNCFMMTSIYVFFWSLGNTDTLSLKAAINTDVRLWKWHWDLAGLQLPCSLKKQHILYAKYTHQQF